MKIKKQSERFFLDTNIIIYTFDSSSKAKQTIASSLVSEGLSSGLGIISHQVIQEFVSVAQSKFKRSFDVPRLTVYLDEVLYTLWRAYPDRELYLAALALQSRYHLSWWDSLIVAAAQATGCKTVYSEDLHHGQQIDTVTLMNPFKT